LKEAFRPAGRVAVSGSGILPFGPERRRDPKIRPGPSGRGRSCRVSRSSLEVSLVTLTRSIAITLFPFLVLVVVEPLRSQAPQALTPAYLDALDVRAIGPALVGGRVSDFAVNEANPAMFYVGMATGGLWKTMNGGTTWEVLFDDQPDTVSIGDIAIGPRDPNLVWVGTGENNNRQSSSWGNGVYKSTDGGASWQHMGLAETRHIGRIVIDPTDSQVVFVAATGDLWGPGRARGVFKTTDGGVTWSHALFLDEHTGATELVMDPSNPQVLYAGLYQRRRAVWGFIGGGPGGGIHKTTDGGRTWTRLGGGLPTGLLGRIGMDVFRARPNVLYARVEHATEGGVYRTDDAGLTWRRMSPENPRPMYYSQIRVDPGDDSRIYVLGESLRISADGGRTWVSNRSAVQDGLWPPGSFINAATHSDHHAFWIDPKNTNHLLTGNDGGVSVSFDRGLTWRMLDNMDIAQFYHVGFDMDVPYRVHGGMQDNLSFSGVSATRSYLGIGNDEWTLIGAGDGFASFADPTDSNIVYTEAQNGAVVRVDRRTNERKSIRPEPPAGQPRYRWNWNTPLMLSPHDPRTLYIGAQMVFRTRDRGHSWEAISPDLTSGADRETFSLMDIPARDFALTRNDGVSAWPTLTSLAESPKRAGLLYAGSDDGLVQVTRDGGRTWTTADGRFPGLPEGLAVAGLVASHAVESRAYAVFDGHQRADYGSYIYATEDTGATWTRIVDGLPNGHVVRTMAEDLQNPDVLYAGTEFGLFVSIDRGRQWTRWRANLPTVPVYGIAQHPRENDLILATHGRGIWIADDVRPVQQAAEALRSPHYLFALRPARQFNRANDRWWMNGDQRFWGHNPPFGALITYRLGADARDVRLRLAGSDGAIVRELRASDRAARAGVHRTTWDLRHPPLERRGGPAAPQEPPLPGAQVRSHMFQQIDRPEVDPLVGPFVLPGDYRLTLVVDGLEVGSRMVIVTPDWLIDISDSDRRTLHEIALTLHGWQEVTAAAAERVSSVSADAVALSSRLGSATSGPQKTLLDALGMELTALRQRLGVTLRGERRSGGGQALGAEIASLKGQVMQSTSLPTAAQQRRVGEIEAALAQVVKSVNHVEQRAWPDVQRAAGSPAVKPPPPLSIKPRTRSQR
jgi:photosystem II stability/assembly factor-like uncharacterized protein